MALPMATYLVITPLPPLAGKQLHRKIKFLRPMRNKLRSMTHTTSSRLPFFSISFTKSENQGEPASSEETSYSILAAVTSRYNEIVVVDTPDTRMLLLDSSHNIHSIFCKETRWTGSYWDEFASLPAIVPQGPIAIFGLGAGTAAHLMLDLWPSLHVEGWEIDGILIDKAREYFALSDLERCTQAGGSLSIHIGDALSPAAKIEGGFAGIIVDLFCDGKILPQLQEVATWLDMEKKLMPHGRIMVNCGGAHAEIMHSGYINLNTSISSKESWVQNSTINAMCRAFPSKISWKRMEGRESENYLALTGPVPDLDAWSAALPNPLDIKAKDWKCCQLA